jgi:hypothetical protein
MRGGAVGDGAEFAVQSARHFHDEMDVSRTAGCPTKPWQPELFGPGDKVIGECAAGFLGAAGIAGVDVDGDKRRSQRSDDGSRFRVVLE